MSAGAERGSALVLAMAALVVLALLSQAVLAGARDTVGATWLERGRTEALAAADGGLALARHRLAADPGWGGGRPTIGRCDVAVEVTARGDGGHDLRLIATCPVRGAGQPVRAVVTASLAAAADGLPAVTAWRELGAD